ncbi:TetR/AcrR family transcriptional regulator [Actinophytocola xanthii]|uniref:TetR family transcriptional regulator n=1 Tax=Actinophytocola xanthii TaxID=1912961 RepID=A0A1Q8CVI6_9PSEU|nr:TetR/AcrR family transcriptional regulator [Actinophytocola xanthii]OLF18375.1 TetR family transcriptional regulator [Actinophytocola xanthii]
MPRDGLTTDQIVRAAIDLLDADGLDGLTMRGLGQRLGCAATAVYWHVENKDNLVRLAVDELWREVRLPDLEANDWRAAATEMATDLHAMVTRHPWLLQALATHLVYGPGKARHDDHLFAVYERAGFVGEQADRAVGAVFVFVLGNAVGPAATVALNRRLRRDGGDAEQVLGEAVARATDLAASYPRLSARLPSPTDDVNAVFAGTFEFGLAALLDGLQARLPDQETAAS